MDIDNTDLLISGIKARVAYYKAKLDEAKFDLWVWEAALERASKEKEEEKETEEKFPLNSSEITEVTGRG